MAGAVLLLFAVSAGAAIQGVVVGDDGAAVAGARVRAFAREPFSATAARLLSAAPEGAALSTAETSANGAFSLDAKGNATVDVVIDAAGRDPAAFTAAEGDDAGAIALVAAGALRLRIVADGKGVPNAVVYLGRSLVVRSDREGFFPFVATGEMPFVVHPDYAVARITDREMALTRGTAIRGRVVGRDGTTPVAGAVVSVNGWPLARSGDDGAFSIAHAPSRTRALLATSSNDAGAALYDAAKPLVIRLGTAASVSGTVTTASKGDDVVAGASVAFGTIDGELFSAITNARGRFAIAALPPGTYGAMVYHPVYAGERAGELRVAAGTTRSFVLTARPRVRGTVIGDDRKPLPGALVSLAATFIGGAGSGVVVPAGPNGEFSLRLPAAGAMTLVAAKSGYATAMVGPVVLESGETKSGVTIALVRGFPLRITVVDSERQPVAGAAIEITISGADIGAPRLPIPCSLTDRDRCRLTAADGTYETRLAEGTYDIDVKGDLVPLALQAQALTARSSPMTLTVDRGVDVSGRVSFSDGTPVAGARVTARMSSPRSAVTDANGAFTLQRLPRTPLTLLAMTTDEPPLQSPPVDVTPPARNVAIAMPTPATIEGRVVDRATSQPVTAFTVMPQRKDAQMAMRGAQFTAPDGAFVLKRVAPGSLELRVTAPGYVTATVTDLNVEEGKTLRGVEVKLDRGARVSGRVTAGGKGIAGVAVVYGGRNARVSGPPAQSDGDGNYALDGVPAGEQTLDFTKQGFVTKRKTVEVAAGKDLHLDVELDRGREIRGRVSERGGRAVAGARIVAAPIDGAPFSGNATSDAEGQFTISGLEEGRYTVTAQRSGYVSAKQENVDPAAGAPLSLTMDRGATINGRVVGLPAAELAQVRVSATGQGVAANQPVEASGEFALSGIPDGRITVTAYKYGARMRQSAPKVVDVVNGSAPPVEIDFSGGISIRGRVTRNGVPVAGTGNVNFMPRKGASMQSVFGSIGPDGSYEVNVQDVGDYDVRVNVVGSNDVVHYTVTGSATFDIDLRGGAVRGVVLDAASGAPLADARVSTQPSRESTTFRMATSDSEGRFVLDLVPDGTLTLRAEREHYAPSSQTVLVSGGTAPPVELRLQRGTEAIIRIVDAEGGASLQGSVTLVDPRGQFVASGSGRGEDGAIHVWAAPGRYTARVYVPGYGQQSADVIVPGPEVRVVVARGARLVLTSRSGGTFRLRLPAAPPPGANVVGGITTMRVVNVPVGERVPVDGLQPGTYQIEKVAGDMKTVLRTYSVMLASGQTATLDAD